MAREKKSICRRTYVKYHSRDYVLCPAQFQQKIRKICERCNHVFLRWSEVSTFGREILFITNKLLTVVFVFRGRHVQK